jgi:hypothetical protein
MDEGRHMPLLMTSEMYEEDLIYSEEASLEIEIIAEE